MKNIMLNIKNLRDMTGVGFLDCKNALEVNDQNIEKSTCFAGNGYDVNDLWKLADWNGANNGNNYNVIFLEMSATW